MQKVIAILCLSIIVVSCARISMPTGGAKDETPPKFLGSKPDTLAVKVNKDLKEIVLNFDEYVIVREVSKNVIISPPLQVMPGIEPTATARKYISVKFHEPLKENTTYTINFGSGIQDNNEGNKLTDFSYTFTTGDRIDSLQVEGSVKQSLEKGQLPATVASLFKIEKSKSGKDSLNLKNKPYYISKVDEAGNFKLKHLHEGEYRLIAFNDLNSNLIIDSEKEIAGFSTEIINPVKTDNYKIILSPVKQKYKVTGTEQDGQGVIKVKFKGNPEKVTVTSLEKDFPPIKVFHKEYADSLYVYFDNKELKGFDKKARIRFLSQYKEKSDTLSVLYDNSTKTELSITALEKEITPSSYFTLKTNNYVTEIDNSKIQVVKNDIPVDFTTEIDPLSPKNVNIKFSIIYDTDYKVNVNAGAVKDFLEQTNSDTLTYNIKTKSQSSYGNLTIKIQNKPTTNFFFQLLTEKYEVVESIYGDKEEFIFTNMKPQKYLVRILVDENNNKIWDLADIENFIPAEKTHIYPQTIEVRAFWNLNELWVL